MPNWKISLGLLLCILLFKAEAQERNKYNRFGSKLDMRMGVRAGILNANFVGDEFLVEFDDDNLDVYPPVRYDAKQGFTAGIYADIRISDKVILQPEVNYTQMGTLMGRDVDLSNSDGAFIVEQPIIPDSVEILNFKRNLDYLQIPFLIKYPITREFHLMGGPQFAFKLKDETELDGGSLGADELPDPNPLLSEDRTSLFKNTDIGAMLGIVYQMQMGLNFNLRYNRNFKNINKNEGFDPLTLEPKNFNHAFIFSVGYTIWYDKRLKEDISRKH